METQISWVDHQVRCKLSILNIIYIVASNDMSLKDFVIIAKLGEGAYSSVYKVQRILDSQIYALKKVKMNNLSDKQQENALNQVRILASLNSPYIVGYKHSFIEANSLCIVMEFLDDGDLYQKIVAHQKNNTSFDEQTIWKTLIHVTLGLKRLHDFNILHRDLKSANVFLDKSGVSKLGDMNVSKVAKNGLLYTQTGTPYYASPEVWKDKPYDSKSDIWSLGCVIYEMTTLKPPFRAEDMDGLYKKVIKGVYTKIGDNYSKQLSQVIKNMLQVNPSNRPDAGELLMSMQSKAGQLGIDIEHQAPQTKELLKTIRAHKNLHYLTDHLPKSNYNNGQEHQKISKLSQSTKEKNPVSLANYPQPKNINLPKLDRIIIKNAANKYTEEPKKHEIQGMKPNQVDISSMLKIEGKGNQQVHPRYDYEYQLARKQADRDIRAELKKIYNLKPSPKKHNRRMVELPRIN